MASYTTNLAPFINEEFYVTSPFGVLPTRTHRGLDIATIGKKNIYSITNGVVFEKGYQPNGYGYYIIIKSSDNLGVLYGHLDSPSILNQGQNVVIGDYIGLEGTTGSSTGVHLHIEMQYITTSWQYNLPITSYINPAEYMGFPNIQGISVIYNGTPRFIRKKNNFKFVLYARKLRNNKY